MCTHAPAVSQYIRLYFRNYKSHDLSNKDHEKLLGHISQSTD